ncbi:M14 family zinc carboxypeptidase [Amycolatopsis keratiniphila]|uniref:Metallocarboxypeptidase of M14 family n=1 Tax=Amycolatopsis keratiniphila TaxID=129921 RepID=R4SZB0_9PSEU|nr:M14 family zinc carboxypeptidase [Amycolatopsis keratiniphila]AGM05486.1 metallocarboxypeptidase of M14 family [Amycolatopsis keratiniphila]
MGYSPNRRRAGWTAATLVLAGAFVALPSATTAGAADNVVRADKAVPRSCFAALQKPGTSGTDRREFTSTVDGLLQARLAPRAGTEGDWDLAVFDKTTGAVVAASAALRSHELAEGFVKKDQKLVVQTCRYDGRTRDAVLGVDFLSLTPQGTPTGAAPAPQRAELVRVETPGKQDKDKLLRLGLDVTEKADATGVQVVLANDADRKTLADNGFKAKVVDGDLSARSIQNAKTDREYAAKTPGSTLPSGRTSYRHLYDYQFEVKELARKNPGLVTAFTLPQPTWEGRDVLGLEIATDVKNIADGKPVNFTMGVHHAREWPAGEHAMEWAHELVKGYTGNNAAIRGLVGRTRNIIVPIVNPDGFEISREAEPRGDFSRFDYEMKRKNCNVNDSPKEFATGVCKANPGGRERGTDPNRNYAGFWGGAGASTVWRSDTFRGAGPFSEPETQNVRSIVSNRQVTNLITLHTFSNLVLRVPGVAAVRPPLDEPAYKALGDKMASRNGYTSQPSWALYDTTGSTEDWSYWATGGWGFTFEVGPNEFHPPFAEGVVAEYTGVAPAAGAGKGGNRAAFIDMLANTADPAAHSTLIGTAPKGYQLKLHKTFQTPTSPVVQPDGSTKPPIYVTDELNSSLSSTGGRFAWSINPSTRPYVAGRYGREPQGPAQPAIQAVNPAGVPAINQNYPTDPTSESFTFRVDGLPKVDNGKFSVDVKWASQDTDWDLYVFDAAGNMVSSSANGSTTEEHAILYDPPAGEYRAVLVNYSQANPSTVDDWTGGVSFQSPIPPTYGPKEAYQLTCTSPKGKLVGLTDVYIDRGQTVDVGEVCTRSARAKKERSVR